MGFFNYWIEKRARAILKQEGRIVGAERSLEIRKKHAELSQIEHDRKIMLEDQKIELERQKLEFERQKYMDSIGYEEDEPSIKPNDHDGLDWSKIIGQLVEIAREFLPKMLKRDKSGDYIQIETSKARMLLDKAKKYVSADELKELEEVILNGR